MKRKILIAILSVVAIVCGIFGIACDNNNGGGGGENPGTNPGQLEPITFAGMNVTKNIILEKGSFYQVKLPLAMDSIGNVLNVTFVVKDADDNEVKDDSAGFFVVDDTYTIEYTAVMMDGTKKTATTKVTSMLFAKYGMHNNIVSDKFDFKTVANFPKDKDGNANIPEGFEMVYDVVFAGKAVENAVNENHEFVVEGLHDGTYDITATCQGDGTSYKLFEIKLDVCTDASKPVWHYADYMDASDLIVTGWRREVIGNSSVVDASTVSGGLFGKTEGKFYKAVQGTEDALCVSIKPTHIKSFYESENFIGQEYKVRFSYLMTTANGEWIDYNTAGDPSSGYHHTPQVKVLGVNKELGVDGLNTWHQAEISYDSFVAMFDKLSAYDPNQATNPTTGACILSAEKGLEVTTKTDKSVIFYISPITIERFEKINDSNLEAPVWQTDDTMDARQMVLADWRNEIKGNASIVDASTVSGGLFGKTEGKFYKAVQSTSDCLSVNIAPRYDYESLEKFIGQGYKIKFQWLMTTVDGAWHCDGSDGGHTPSYMLYNSVTSEKAIDSNKTAQEVLGVWYDAEVDFDAYMANWDNMTKFVDVTRTNYLLSTTKGLGHTGSSDKSVIFYLSAFEVVQAQA